MTALSNDIGPLHLSEFYAKDPWTKYRWLRREAPVLRYESDQGSFWVLSRHADVCTATRNPQLFSSKQGFLMPGPQRDQVNVLVSGSIMATDPPVHTDLRRLVRDYFSPRAVSDMEDEIRGYVNQVLGELQPRQPFDLVQQVAARVPIYVISVLMGIPPEDRTRFMDAIDASAAYSDPASMADDQGAAAMAKAFAFFQELVEDCRHKHGDNIVSALIRGRIQGEPVDSFTIAKTAFLIMVGGSETTRHLISLGTLALIEHPDQLQMIKERPDLLPKAIEEMLRWISPVRYFARTATADTVLRDQTISAGDRVVLLFASANRDEEVFGADAEDFKVSREPNPHVAFAHGEHFCLGAHLARLEARIYFEEVLRRFTRWEVAGVIERVHEPEICGLKKMVVAFR